MIGLEWEWDWPWGLVLLFLVPVVVYFMVRSGGRSRLRFSCLADVAVARRSWRVPMRWLVVVARVVCVVLLVLALARPRQGSKQHKQLTRGVVMQLVVDRSSSMNAEMTYKERRSNRLGVVKRVLRDFVAGGSGLQGRENDLLGLITFARYADTLCPLVHGHDTLLGFLAETRLAQPRSGEDGTAIGEAIALAVARLATAAEDIKRRNAELAALQSDSQEQLAGEFEIESKVIVLLTDGVNNAGEHTPIDATKWAKENGIKIYTIGIGSRKRGGFFDLRGAEFDERLLKWIAQYTGGFYSRADDDEALLAICAKIDELEKSEIESIEYSEYEELFSVLAFGALIALASEMFMSATVFRKSP